MALDEFFTVEEIATALKVNPRTIQREIERKRITAVRVGRQYRITENKSTKKYGI